MFHIIYKINTFLIEVLLKKIILVFKIVWERWPKLKCNEKSTDPSDASKSTLDFFALFPYIKRDSIYMQENSKKIKRGFFIKS